MSDDRPSAITPVHFAEITDAETVNRALLAAYQRERDGEQVRRSHMFGGRFENTYIDAGRLPELAPVRDFALASARRILGRDTLHFGFWFNEMQPGHNTSLHTHEEDDELLSAVYYVTATADSGRLLLHDDEAQIAVTPRPGLLVLFPPDLPHEVEVNASDQARLSIAFNFGPPRPPT
jgi:uncharacterized RmlC-like cupin family protein